VCDSGYTGALTQCISNSCPTGYSASTWGMCSYSGSVQTTGTCKESKYGKKFGGLCYDNDVDTGALVKVPFYGCPSDQTKNGALCYFNSATFRKEGKVYRSKTCATDCKGPYAGVCWAKVLGWVSGGCSSGYTLKAGMCYANSKPMTCDGGKNMGLNCQVDFKPSYLL